MGDEKTRVQGLVNFPHDGSDRDDNSLKKWTTGHMYYMLAKCLATFSISPEILRMAEFKCHKLNNIVEETARHYNI